MEFFKALDAPQSFLRWLKQIAFLRNLDQCGFCSVHFMLVVLKAQEEEGGIDFLRISRSSKLVLLEFVPLINSLVCVLYAHCGLIQFKL